MQQQNKRAAKHVVIYFSVGTNRDACAQARFVVGNDRFELLESSTDALGVTQKVWRPISEVARGMPLARDVLAKALLVSYSDLPPHAPEYRRLYPDGVASASGVIEINLGIVAP